MRKKHYKPKSKGLWEASREAKELERKLKVYDNARPKRESKGKPNKEGPNNPSWFHNLPISAYIEPKSIADELKRANKAKKEMKLL